jgi:Xaa-Pro aminopeptidase
VPLDARSVSARLAAARPLMRAHGIDALFITPSADFAYLTGYGGHVSERLLALVVGAEGADALIHPAFERQRFEYLSPLMTVVTWEETEAPFECLTYLLNQASVVAVNDGQPARFVLKAQEWLPHATVVSAQGVLGTLRITKMADEITALRLAHNSTDAAFDALCATSIIGLSERAIAQRLADLLLQAGCDAIGSVTVASGANAASPHHTSGMRTVAPGEVVLMDFGGRRDGYLSDVTRTVVAGHPPPGFLEIHSLVAEAQRQALAAAGPGRRAADVDNAARAHISAHGYGAYFTHRVGHGIGLEVHEPPYLTANNQQSLETGMAFSVEPGIYLPDRFGVRIEDTVLVTPDGVETLSKCSREPLVLA